MRLHRLAPALLGAVLPIAVAPAFVALPASAAEPTPPADSVPAAVEALEHAQEVLQGALGGAHAGGHAAHTGEEHVDATLALLELRQALPQLGPADRREARRLMARPDVNTDDPRTSQVEDADNTNGAAWNSTEIRNAKIDCSDGRFCVHWVPAETLPSSPHAATQAEVDATIAAMKRVWHRETGALTEGGLGYREPLGDGTRGGDGLFVGTTNQLDVYLADTGEDHIFGYAVPEGSLADQTSAGYLVLENDFSEFSKGSASVAAGLRQVTAAHEFFHLVQFAYDADEAWWLMESTATWMEEQVYDAVNDNRYYLPVSSLRWPGQSLDTFDDSGAQYGNWVFHQLVSERRGVEAVRGTWNRAALTQGDNAYAALDAALRARRSSLYNEFRAFSGASMAPHRFWSEGRAYPSAVVNRTWALGAASRSTGWRATRINHLASSDYRFRPRAGLTSTAWKLRINVNAPSRGATAYVLVVYKDGRIGNFPLRLNAEGNRTVSFPLSASKVSRVLLSLGNATRAGDARKTTFRATVWR